MLKAREISVLSLSTLPFMEALRRLMPQSQTLATYIRNTYNYDIGGYRNNDEKVAADRVTVKVDWAINAKNKLTISNRYTNGERINATVGNSTAINFFNNAYTFPTRTNSTSLELKSTVGQNSSNRLLLTYTDVLDDRNPIGRHFPKNKYFRRHRYW